MNQLFTQAQCGEFPGASTTSHPNSDHLSLNHFLNVPSSPEGKPQFHSWFIALLPQSY
jgi:hypothetical protein